MGCVGRHILVPLRSRMTMLLDGLGLDRPVHLFSWSIYFTRQTRPSIFVVCFDALRSAGDGVRGAAHPGAAPLAHVYASRPVLRRNFRGACLYH